MSSSWVEFSTTNDNFVEDYRRIELSLRVDNLIGDCMQIVVLFLKTNEIVIAISYPQAPHLKCYRPICKVAILIFVRFSVIDEYRSVGKVPLMAIILVQWQGNDFSWTIWLTLAVNGNIKGHWLLLIVFGWSSLYIVLKTGLVQCDRNQFDYKFWIYWL